MNDFTASNGYVVSDTALSIESTRVVVLDKNRENTLAVGYVSGNDYLDEQDVKALGEFFRAEEDTRLGRWRWPENPDYVVYPNPGEAFEGMFGPGLDLIILRESDGMTKGYVREEDQGKPPMAHRVGHILAARAYFDAHAQSKPWHDAIRGEVWEITQADQEPALYVVENSEQRFLHVERRLLALSIDDPHIIAGRRIWPEVVS